MPVKLKAFVSERGMSAAARLAESKSEIDVLRKCVSLICIFHVTDTFLFSARVKVFCYVVLVKSDYTSKSVYETFACSFD